MHIQKEAVGEFLAKCRTEAKVSQLKLARQIGYSSPQYISNWERGLCGPPVEKLVGICEALNIDPKLIFDMIIRDTEIYLMNELKLTKKNAGKSPRAKAKKP